MNLKNRSMLGLLIVLLVVLFVNPRMVNNIYETILGRIVLIGLVIFLSRHNTTLGLLVALAIIVASNKFGSFTEGMENAPTVGDDSATTVGSQPVLTKSADTEINVDDIKKKLSDLKDAAKSAGISSEGGVDKEAIKQAIMSKQSNQVPVSPDVKTTEEVSPSTQVEGFANNCAAV